MDNLASALALAEYNFSIDKLGHISFMGIVLAVWADLFWFFFAQHASIAGSVIKVSVWIKRFKL